MTGTGIKLVTHPGQSLVILFILLWHPLIIYVVSLISRVYVVLQSKDAALTAHDEIHKVLNELQSVSTAITILYVIYYLEIMQTLSPRICTHVLL